MDEQSYSNSGLVQAFILDGRGSARSITHEQLETLRLADGESLWLHWDRSHPQTGAWLRESSNISEFACDLLLEENTRPRLLDLPGQRRLLFLRGINLNPGAEPEDMVSLRIHAEPQRLISLRLRPLRATDELAAQLLRGEGPRGTAELALALAHQLTARVEGVLDELAEQLDAEEERLDADERYVPEHDAILHLRRRSAGLRRFLAPQRELFAQLARSGFGSGDLWNELNNRLTRYLEELEMVRERVVLVLESEDRRMSDKMNRTMYLLGIITGLFLPMSFLTGLLGINVGGIPGSQSEHGFLLTCLMILALVVFQLWLFRRLRWL